VVATKVRSMTVSLTAAGFDVSSPTACDSSCDRPNRGECDQSKTAAIQVFRVEVEQLRFWPEPAQLVWPVKPSSAAGILAQPVWLGFQTI
jgi:hypothetical protein